MKRGFSAVTMYFCSLSLALGAVTAHAEKREIAGLEFMPQEQSNWCWAATAHIIAHKNGANPESQCQLASRFIKGQPGDFCCQPNNAASIQCNQPWYTGRALDHYGVLDAFSPGPIAPEQIVDEIKRGYPVALTVAWASGGGHVVTIYGAADHVTPDGKKLATLTIWDTGNQGDRFVMSYKEAQTYRGGTWNGTYTTKCPGNNCG